jgi:N-methylhydantoinase B
LPGRPSTITLNPGTDGEREISVADGGVQLRPGDVVRMDQAGGGGYGDPFTRPVDEVLRDVREGYVSADAARTHYGVAVVATVEGWQPDAAETERLRSANR